MAIDYGDARTGVAISDLTGTLTGFTAVIQSRREEDVLSQLVQLISQRQIEELVVGFPRNMDGSEGPRAELYRSFAQKLEEASLKTIESGKMTKDLALITTLPDPTVLSSGNFIREIRKTLEELLHAV